MHVPVHETLMLPVLRLFGEGAGNVAECLPRLKIEFGVSDKGANKFQQSGRVTVLQNRMHWAWTYLSKAGLRERPERNHHVMTSKGRDILSADPTRIDNAFLGNLK